MTRFLASVAIAVLIASPANAAAVTPSPADALLSTRLEVDTPDTGPVIIECGPGPTQSGLEARFLHAAFATQTASRPLCPRLESETTAQSKPEFSSYRVIGRKTSTSELM
jgi:hypothetical protein